MDTSRYYTPAYFKTENGDTVVHAPSGHDLELVKPVSTFYGSDPGFLELGDRAVPMIEFSDS
jgi:hypothetical protein